MIERKRLHNFEARFSEYRGLSLQSSILYCGCGYPILARHIEAESVTECRFYSYLDYEQELFLCPQCGSLLQEAGLSSTIPEGV